MLQRSWIVVLTFLAAAFAAACNSAHPIGCSDPKSCPAGNVCTADHKCVQVCEADVECVKGNRCDDGLCVSNEREGVPSITTVAGTSSQNCSYNNAPVGKCVGNAIALTGLNFTGSAFKLVSSVGIGATVALKPVGGVQNGYVELSTPNNIDIPEGQYALIATNGAGDAAVQVNLLRGEKGVDGTNGVDGQTGPAGPGSGTFSLYNNSTSPTNSVSSFDKMHVSLAASSTGIASLAIDNSKLLELCGDADGCSVSLGFTGFRPSNAPNTPLQVPVYGPECRIFMRSVSAGTQWTISDDCTRWYALWDDNGAGLAIWKPANTGNIATNPGFYTPYAGSTWGIDGADTVEGAQNRKILLGFKNGCYFSETVPSNPITSGQLEVDAVAPQFYFYASHPDYGTAFGNPSPFYPPAAQWAVGDARTCELTIQD